MEPSEPFPADTDLPPPFLLEGAHSSAIPVLIAVPHAGRAYPTQLLAQMRDPEVRIRLEDRHVDTLARQIANLCGAPLLIASAPRAQIDLNRAPADIDWTMIAGPRPPGQRHSQANRRARSGLGLVPRRLSGSGEIWRGPLPHEELERRIRTVHRPYHEALGAALERLRSEWGAVLLIDLHSMPPLVPKRVDERAAEFVIGDRFGASCDARLSAMALNHLGRAGRLATHNRPYSGGYVLDRHGSPRRNIFALQVEVCRSLYLDRQLQNPSARLPTIARLLAGMVRKLADQTSLLGLDTDQLLAGE